MIKKTMFKFLAGIVLFFQLLLCETVFADHHIPELATTIELGQSVNNSLSSVQDKYYELNVPESGTLVLYTEGGIDTYGELMLADETKLGTSDSGGEGANFSISAEVSAGTYYIRVLNLESGDYTLITELVSEAEENPGVQVALDQTLAGVRTTDGSATSAVLTAGATADGGITVSTEFTSTQDILILGAVSPQPEDLGQFADIFVVLRTITDSESAWSYRDADGIFRPWSGKISELEPAYEISVLSESEVVEIMSGSLQTASHRVFIGYSLEDGPLHYNGFGMKLDVLAE